MHGCTRLSHQPVTATWGISSRAAFVRVSTETSWSETDCCLQSANKSGYTTDGCCIADLQACLDTFLGAVKAAGLAEHMAASLCSQHPHSDCNSKWVLTAFAHAQNSAASYMRRLHLFKRARIGAQATGSPCCFCTNPTSAEAPSITAVHATCTA